MRVGRGSIYVHVDDAGALAEEWRGAGVDFVEPQDFEYGKREGSHRDPDGNRSGHGEEEADEG